MPLLFKLLEIWSVEIVAIRCQILRLKCTKFNFGWGSAPDPAGGAYSAPPEPLAGFKGPTSKGREGKGNREGKEGIGKKERGGREKGEGWEGKKGKVRGQGGRGGKREKRENLGGRGPPIFFPRTAPDLEFAYSLRALVMVGGNVTAR